MKYFNYAKTCRKKTGLNQNEVAYLIGLKSPHFISQTELGNEIPALSRLLIYHILCDKQIEKIFPDLSEKVSLDIFKRIAKLSKQLQHKKQTEIIKRKIINLDLIAEKIANKYK